LSIADGVSMNNVLISFLTQLAGQSPVLFVYLVGMALALVFWRRYPRPCALVLIAMGFLMLTSMGQAFVSLYFIQRGVGLDWEPQRVGRLLMINTLAGSFVRALAFGLLLAAVFVGREPRREAKQRSEDSVS